MRHARALTEDLRMPPTFEPSAYTSVPTRNPATTLSLSRTLLAAAPRRPSTTVRKRLVKLRARATEMQAAWVDLSRPVPTVDDLRPFDFVLDRRWSAVRSRLEGCMQLGDDDQAPRAERMVATLFATGLDFLKLPYTEQWAQSERRLAQIETDDLADELEALVGESYLPLLRQAHAAYGKALGITEAREAASEPARVLEPLRALQAAIASYARAVVGEVDEDDEDDVKAVMQQLDPIRRARRTRAAGEPEPSEPFDVPLPEVGEAGDASA
ncbi:hypothetical protein [Paraliomyxa miuraensis]|uniref:hypothetical protein n=1 Tax=Paraliomyxa miuraensis TaxID=376150 RepID=UPI002255313F|nr:hypothetical protein [Paraliomyxa miuraensis]MCX4242965.1 hypothetical protein [Paraliomyxa miuraensis]